MGTDLVKVDNAVIKSVQIKNELIIYFINYNYGGGNDYYFPKDRLEKQIFSEPILDYIINQLSISASIDRNNPNSRDTFIFVVYLLKEIISDNIIPQKYMPKLEFLEFNFKKNVSNLKKYKNLVNFYKNNLKLSSISINPKIISILEKEYLEPTGKGYLNKIYWYKKEFEDAKIDYDNLEKLYKKYFKSQHDTINFSKEKILLDIELNEDEKQNEIFELNQKLKSIKTKEQYTKDLKSDLFKTEKEYLMKSELIKKQINLLINFIKYLNSTNEGVSTEEYLNKRTKDMMKSFKFINYKSVSPILLRINNYITPIIIDKFEIRVANSLEKKKIYNEIKKEESLIFQTLGEFDLELLSKEKYVISSEEDEYSKLNIKYLLLSLRLVQNSDVYCPILYTNLEEPYLLLSSNYKWLNKDYILENKDISQINKLFISMKNNQQNNINFVLDKLNYSLFHFQPNSTLFLDYVSILETLILKGHNELRYKFSVYVSYILKEYCDINVKFSEIREIYDKRSEIVHSLKSENIDSKLLLKLEYYVVNIVQVALLNYDVINNIEQIILKKLELS